MQILKIIFLGGLLLFYRDSLSQSLKIVPPTPNASKMTEYFAQLPNMYTGTANVTIPLHFIDFEGWKLPLTLSYNATGIRTNEEAAEVGLGWALSATGVISRTIRGGDDLFQGGPIHNRKGYVYNDLQVTFDTGYVPGSIPAENSYFLHLVRSGPDTEPDIFNYNFFGFSGSFVLSQKVATNNIIEVIKVTEDATRISFNESGQSFIVITPSGYIGEFTVKEKSTSFSGSIVTNDRMQCCSEANIDIDYLKNESGRFRTTTSWYLSRITSPKGEIIDFNYDLNPDGSSPYLSNSIAFAELENITSQETCLQTVQEHVYLKSIVSEEIRVDFTMQTREDLRKNNLYIPSGARVEFPYSNSLKRFVGISITGLDPASTLNKSISLTQNYFNQQYHKLTINDENEVRWLRSRLDKVIIDDQEYRFYYEKGTNGLPNKLTTGIDHFGFYNGNENIRVLPLEPVNPSFGNCALNDTATVVYYKQFWDRRVEFDYGKAGLLTKVNYPTKGYSVFEYEPHRYLPGSTGSFREVAGVKYAGGARIKSIKEFDYTNDQVPVRHKIYRYVESAEDITSTFSTGKLMTPLYNRYPKLFHDPINFSIITGCEYLYRTYSSIPGNNAAEGKVIGYTKVHELVIGSTDSYKSTYYFENRPNNTLKWNAVAVGTPNLNGQLMEVRNYNSLGKIVQLTKNNNYEHPPLGTIKAIAYEQDPGNQYWLKYYVGYEIKRTFDTPLQTVTTTPISPSGIVEDANGNITSWGNFIQTTKNLTFNGNYLLKTEESTNSKGEIMKSEFKRPGDYSTPGAAIIFMKSKNIVDPVIEEISYKNGTVISAFANQYIQSGSRVDLLASYAFNKSLGSFTTSPDGITFSTPYEKKVDYLAYDTQNGNLLEYKAADGIVNSFIWWHNDKLPIVHGVGIGYTMLNQAHTSALSNGAYGSGAYENSLRNNSNAVGKSVTTYLHNPQVGILRVTDPSLLSKSFEYDQYARLKKVLDNDGKTLEQYQYHFREVQPTRILSVSGLSPLGEIDFGTLTPDMFVAPFIPYERCSDDLRTKILTLSNSGEEDLTISSLTLPSTAFTSSWQGGVISPGTSLDVIITFNSASALGNHTSNIAFSSNRTNTEPINIPIKAIYATRLCNVSVSTAVLDFGMTGSNIYGRSFNVINNGNAPIGIIAAPLDWDGQNPSNGYGQYTHPDFSISSPTFTGPLNPICLQPGQSMNFQANFYYHGSGPSSTKMSLIVDECPNLPGLRDIISIQANTPVTRIINVTTSPSTTLPAFTAPSVTQNITVSNSGNATLDVSGFTTSPSNTMFSISPSSFSVPAGGQQIITLTFTPPAYNFSLQTTTLTFTSNQTSGTNSITLSGQRTPIRNIQLSSNSLVFDYTGQTQNVTITNPTSSNDYLNITGVSYPATANWSATLTPIVLTPGQSTNLSITRTTGANEPLNFTVNSNKNGTGNAVVQVGANTRIINVSTSPSTTLPAFTAASISQNITVSNATGNSPLTINSVSSTNAMFAVTLPNPVVFPFSIPAGSQQVVTVTFTPTAYNFSSQSGTLTFNGNQTSGTSSITINGQRTSTRVIQLSTNSFAFDAIPFTPQNITITNNGNDYLSITGVTNPNTPQWDATISNLPVTLTPGQSTTMAIMKKVAEPATVNLTVLSNKTSGNEVVQVSSVSRIMGLSSTNITFPYFTTPSLTQNVTVSNSGNATLSVSSVYSSNAKFTVSPTSFNILAGGNQVVTITYTATDFSLQTGTITFNGNPTSGATSLSVTAQRASPDTMILGISPTSLALPAFTDPSISQNITISNTGNAPLIVSSVSSTNTMFSASPTSFTVPAGGQQVVSVTLTPSSYNFTPQSTTLTFNANQTSGTNTIAVTGQRTAVRTLQLSASSLVYDYTGQQQSVTVTNVSTSNDYLNISGISPTSTSDWSASITTANLVPGQSTTLTITRLTSNPVTQNFTVTSNKISGSDVVQASANTRIIGMSSVSFPSFTSPTASQNMTVSNTGNNTLSVTNITSTNSRFTISPSSFTVAPGGNQVVTVTYTPTDFTSQGTTINVTSNATSGTTSVNTSAQRTQVVQLSLSSTSLVVRPQDPTPSSYLTNTGNVAITINSAGLGGSVPSAFTVSLQRFDIIIWVNVTLPYVLQPGQQLRVVAATSQSGIYTSATATYTINTSIAGSYIINLSRATF